jgi:hypothetical protein
MFPQGAITVTKDGINGLLFGSAPSNADYRTHFIAG